jgi:hypothetical protein
VLFEEAANINLIVFVCLTQPYPELKINNIRGTHNSNYTTDVTVYALFSTLPLENWLANLLDAKKKYKDKFISIF